MAKKNINIILIVGVALIWGLLIYEFLGNSFVNKEDQKNYATTIYEELPTSIQKDTFDLKEYSRDPFLGRANNAIKHNALKSKGLHKVKKPVVVANIRWPQLQYLGFVKEEKAKEPLLLLKVNGRLMRKKSSFEFYEGMKVLGFYKDSLLVGLSNEKRAIKKG